MRSLVIAWTERGLTIALLPIADILRAGQDLINAAYSYNPDEVHQAANRWHEVVTPRARERLWCVLFGHTGDAEDSGYHICCRCHLHSFHHSRYIDPELSVDYDRCALLMRPYWWLCGKVSRFADVVWRLRRKRSDQEDIPF